MISIPAMVIATDPTMKRGMINLHTTLSHHFLDLPVADWMRHISAQASQNDIALKRTPFKRDDHPIPQKQPTENLRRSQ
jgi:hypothetical protein